MGAMVISSQVEILLNQYICYPQQTAASHPAVFLKKRRKGLSIGTHTLRYLFIFTPQLEGGTKQNKKTTFDIQNKLMVTQCQK